MIVETWPVGPLQVNCYLVGCPETMEAMLVDPGSDAETILAGIRDSGFKVRTIVNTHGHFDHIGANRPLVEATGAELCMHADDVPLIGQALTHAALYGLSTDESPLPDRLLCEGDVVRVGNLSFTVLHIPGHSAGSICLHGEGHLFVGDVLFAGSVGRTDLPGGSHELLIAGIKQKLLPLADETLVHTGHGPDTTIGLEKQVNPFLS
jgi:glyoxylase-like metal-dependent hydrolase (beta-lactamase superfamily II)